MVVAEAGEALNEGPSAEIGATGDYQPGGSPAVWESMISMISMGFGMWLPHADGKSVIGLFYDSFVANELHEIISWQTKDPSRIRIRSRKYKVGANYAGEFIRRYSPKGSVK